MSEFAIYEAFVDACPKLADLDGLRSLLDQASRELGFDYFALVQHVDLTDYARRRVVALTTYPTTWIDHYVAHKLVADDPVHLASHRTNVGFSWDRVGDFITVTSAHRRLREETRRSGVGDGFTIPTNIPGEANASCSFAMAGTKALPIGSLSVAQLIGAFAFETARRLVRDGIESTPPRLSPRQLECVLWAARGKSVWETAQILGLKPDTVTEYLEAARQRFAVARRIQLIPHAIHGGQISLSDMLR